METSGPLLCVRRWFHRLCSGYRPTEMDLPANESGASTRRIEFYESEKMINYRQKINDIWTFQVLEKNYGKWKNFFQGLPSTNFKQWDNFLNGYPDLKNLVGSLNEDLGSWTEDDSKTLLKQLQQERGKAQTEANKLLTEMNAVLIQIKKTFCGLETSPLNLKTRKISKGGSNYHYNDVRENLKKRFPGLSENVYCSPGLEKIEEMGKRKNKKCKKKEDQDNEYKGVIMVVNRFVSTFQTLFPKGNPMTILSNYYYNINRKHNSKEDKDDEGKGVIRVVMMFQEIFLEGQTPSPMFILTNYQFPNILKYVKGIKVSSQNGDFDIIIVSKKYSCFFIVEIKACKRNATNLTKCIFEANAQLFKYCTIIQETFRDRPDILEFPVYDSIAIPFVDRGTLKGIKEKKKKKEFENMKLLLMDDLKDDKAFTDWFGRSFPQVSQHSSMDDDQYYTIVERFAGIGSKVDENSSQIKFEQEDIANSKQFNLRNVFLEIKLKQWQLRLEINVTKQRIKISFHISGRRVCVFICDALAREYSILRS